MNTPVSFEIAKLLKEKGISIDGKERILYSNYTVYENEYPDYTIADVVMWLYDNHGIWIECFIDDDKTFGYLISKISEEGRLDFPIKGNFVTPTEAYQAAFEYTLNNLIP
jgi:hypothetical protein